MSDAGRAPATGSYPTQNSRPGSLLNSMPSWLVSVAIHGSLLLLFASGLKSCGDGSLGMAESDFRQVGLHLKQSESLAESLDEAENPTETPTDAKFSEQSSLDSDVETEPPVDILLPSVDQISSIGLGELPNSVVPDDISKFANSSGIRSAAQASDSGPGETGFFGIRDQGTRFVYVLDCSGSMRTHNAIGVAKAELMSSLHGLDARQQFQIIFYNTDPHIMSLRGKKKGELFWATDINRTLSGRFIRQIDPDFGTDHRPALMMALKLNVDVIFFLTDAGTILRGKELVEIKKMNKGRTRIHCVEFGVRGQLRGLKDENFLEKLARQNGGRYRYCDVTKFGRK